MIQTLTTPRTNPRATSHPALGFQLRVASFAFAAAALVFAPKVARADEDAQREALARIVYEISRLEQLASDTAKQQEANSRTRFRYDWLARDLALVRRGVEDHLDAPRQPRPVPVLRGDYRP
jgi:RAQPRD family integrative conjugative element protein